MYIEGTSEIQLGLVLEKLLPMLCDKLASTVDGVRGKTMEILQHITKRLKSNSTIQVPCKELLERVVSSSSSPFSKNFSLIFLDIGFSRLDKTVQTSLYPSLLLAAQKCSESQRDMLLYLALVAMESGEGVPSESTFEPFVNSIDAVEIAFDFFLDIILYRRPSKAESEALIPSGAVFIPPGLNEKGTYYNIYIFICIYGLTK